SAATGRPSRAASRTTVWKAPRRAPCWLRGASSSRWSASRCQARSLTWRSTCAGGIRAGYRPREPRGSPITHPARTRWRTSETPVSGDPGRAKRAVVRATMPHILERDPSRLVGRILGDFTLCERLGAGGGGVVHRAEQRLLGREVVVKLLHARGLEDPGL